MRAVVRVRSLGLLLSGLLLPAASPELGSAQDSALDRVETMAAAGRVDQAREILMAWWGDDRSGVTRQDRQRALWLRGSLTVDRSLAELDYHRLALEYPGGPYSARALERLGMGAQAAGEWDEASEHFQRIVTEYPSAPEAAAARIWLSRWGARPSRARAGSLGDRTVREPAATSAGGYAVQLGAFQSMARARVVEERAREAGLRPRLVTVEGSDLIRIRVGRFGTSEEASGEMNRIRDLGFDATLTDDAGREASVTAGPGS